MGDESRLLRWLLERLPVPVRAPRAPWGHVVGGVVVSDPLTRAPPHGGVDSEPLYYGVKDCMELMSQLIFFK